MGNDQWVGLFGKCTIQRQKEKLCLDSMRRFRGAFFGMQICEIDGSIFTATRPVFFR